MDGTQVFPDFTSAALGFLRAGFDFTVGIGFLLDDGEKGRDGHQIVAVAEAGTSGNSDEEVFLLARNTKAILITRDYHFTNPLRFPPNKTAGIIYIRQGNPTSEEEIHLYRERYCSD
jgi:Domain of unknown function (DUF5615)